MQTFLPGNGYFTSADALDASRRNKQLLECVQMLKALETGQGMGAHHPATLAWRFHKSGLADYASFIADACPPDKYTEARSYVTSLIGETTDIDYPPWYVDALVSSHKGHLYRKDSKYYELFAQFKDLPLLYPVVRDDHPDFPGKVAWGFVARVERPGKPSRFVPCLTDGSIIDGAGDYPRAYDAAKYAAWTVEEEQ